MNKCLILLTLIVTVDAHGENIIRSIWNSVNNNQNDLSKTHSSITKVGSRFYYYKLKPSSPVATPKQTSVSHHEYDHVAIAAALKAQNQTHPDNHPVERKVDKISTTNDPDQAASRNDKDVMYGDASPLQNQAIIDAWARADAAKSRLEAHRKYMEQVRQSKKIIEQSKTVTSANQTAAGTE
jgi:hypothetical protein